MRKLFSLCFLLSSILLQAQLSQELYQWEDHFSFTNIQALAKGNGKLYAAAEYGVVIYNPADGSIQTITRSDGLSGIGLVSINYYEPSNAIVVGYNDGNIDIITSNGIENVGDIKRADIPGNKAINRIVIQGEDILLCTGFGIVQFDLANKNLLDTYKFGPNGTAINVHDAVIYQGFIYAGTEIGLFKADENEPVLTNFQVWEEVEVKPELIGKPFNEVEVFRGDLLVNCNLGYPNDKLYLTRNGGNWDRQNSIAAEYEMASLTADEDKLSLSTLWGHFVYDNNYNQIFKAKNFEEQLSLLTDGFMLDDKLYLSTTNKGLLIQEVTDTPYSSFIPNGPRNSDVWRLVHNQSELWVATGAITTSNTNNFKKKGIHHLKNGQWETFSKVSDTLWEDRFDVLSVAVDPTNPNHVYAGTWGWGLIELLDGKIIKVYDETNSPIETRPEWPETNYPSYIFYDNNGILWIASSYAGKLLKALKPDGTWLEFDLGSDFGNRNFATIHNPIYSSNGHFWLVKPREGVYVYDPGKLDVEGDERSRFLTTSSGNGGLPGNDVKTVAEDLDGEIWVGTDKGIGIFYSPQFVFDGDIDAQQVFIEQDGNVQIVLETEQVNVIKVDGGNRKWIGTSNSGLFLFSKDGARQLQHFTSTNSPLISNNILDISIDPNTGEVFIATNKGIQSFQSDAKPADFDIDDIVIYPNPVEKSFEGKVVIDGLIPHSDVRITDINGNLVYYTTSEGGRATWDTNNLKGEPVLTGVYLVFTTGTLGEETSVSKLMILR